VTSPGLRPDPAMHGSAWIEACGWKVLTRTHRTPGGLHFLLRHAEGTGLLPLLTRREPWQHSQVARRD
jgi:hypothetical protein